MSCDDEKEILDKEQDSYDTAKDDYDRAKESADYFQWQYDTARLNTANCNGDCGDALDKASQAGDDLKTALDSYFEKEAAYDEARFWLDDAKELYCDCTNSESAAGDDVGPIA